MDWLFLSDQLPVRVAWPSAVLIYMDGIIA